MTYAVDQGAGKSSCSVHEESSPTLACTHGGAPAVAYTLKVRSGCAVDSAGKSAGKGALIQTDKAGTLSTVQDQYLFQPVKDTHIIDNIGGQAEYAKASPVNGTLRAGALGAVAYSVENHPADSRVNLDESGKVQTLTSRMGTGGGNVPMVMEQVVCMATQQGVADILNTIDRPTVAYSINHQGGNVEQVIQDKTGTLTASMNSSGNNKLSVAYGIDRAAYNQGQNAKYDFSVLEEQQPTMVARGPGAVTYSSSKASFFTRGEEELANTLVATDYKDPPLINDTHDGHYIVRRLTPTECARLQGFPDRWGDINPFNPDEWEFWAEVRNTHAAINGKKVQEYTAKQMETWYNKLHTDSAEYKMWGNGIAIPPALYVMQGMMDAFIAAEVGKRLDAFINTETEEDDSWML